MEVQIAVKVADSTMIQELKFDREALESGSILEVTNSSTGALEEMVYFPSVKNKKALVGREIYTATFTSTPDNPAIAASSSFYTSFDRFGQLPAEVANMIWKYALPGPRTIKVTAWREKINKEDMKTREMYQWHDCVLVVNFGVHPVATALLHTCRVSRDIALQKYVACSHGHQKPIFFSCKEDTLYFPSGNDFLEFSGIRELCTDFNVYTDWRHLLPRWTLNWQRHIQHIAINYMGIHWTTGIARQPLPSEMIGKELAIAKQLCNLPSLKTITGFGDAWLPSARPSLAISYANMPLRIKSKVYTGSMWDHWVGKWTKPLNFEESALIEHEHGFQVPEFHYAVAGVVALRAYVTEMTKDPENRWMDIAVVLDEELYTKCYTKFTDLPDVRSS